MSSQAAGCRSRGWGEVIEEQMQFLCDCFKTLCSHVPPLVFLSPGFDLVWENRGDRQHAKPRLCQEVHPGLLL